MEQERLLSRPGTIRERADCDDGLVLIRGEEFVEPCVAEGGEEMLAAAAGMQLVMVSVEGLPPTPSLNPRRRTWSTNALRHGLKR